MSDFPTIKLFDGKKFRLIFEGSEVNAEKMAKKCRKAGSIFCRVVKESGAVGKRARHAVYARIE
jgi:hypothetical protein